jgi:hypothetical protein
MGQKIGEREQQLRQQREAMAKWAEEKNAKAKKKVRSAPKAVTPKKAR